MRDLIYTDSDLVVTPIIDNPKVWKDTLATRGLNLGDVFIPNILCLILLPGLTAACFSFFLATCLHF